MSEELEKRLLKYEESGDYVEDGLLEKAAAELKAQRQIIDEQDAARRSALAARDKALADVKALRDALQEIADQTSPLPPRTSWARYLEGIAKAALKETEPKP